MCKLFLLMSQYILSHFEDREGLSVKNQEYSGVEI